MLPTSPFLLLYMKKGDPGRLYEIFICAQLAWGRFGFECRLVKFSKTAFILLKYHASQLGHEEIKD